MRLLLIILLSLIILAVYLNRSYAAFYNNIGKQNLKTPLKQVTFTFENSSKTGYKEYLALGDSLSSGVGSNNYESAFTYIYAKKLAGIYAGIKFTNLSKPGATSEDVLKKQLPGAILANPDTITLLVGVNDIHNLVSDTQFGQNYKHIIEQLINKTNAQILVLNIPYLASDTILFPPYNYLLDWRTNQFNTRISPYCNFKRIKCINLYTPTKTVYSQNPAFYSVDLFHPSAWGYTMWAENINVD